MPTEIIEDDLKKETDNSISSPVSINKSNSSNTSISGAGFLSSNGELETISIKCYDRLIEELKCPGCAIPMRAPIRLCAQGHSICDDCTNRLENCPLCKASFTLTRSLTLEALTVKAQFCCSYASAGCKARLPLDLLSWHERQCELKIIKCFMGRVWGECDWMGREGMWPDHLVEKHMDRVYKDKFPIEMQWNMQKRLIPLAGYYVLHWENQVFNLYHIFDKENSRVLWSMTVAGKTTKGRNKKFQFAFEVEVYSPDDETKAICQRYPCRMEMDKDILQEGTCVSISMADIARFTLEPHKVVNYRVNIHKVKITAKRASLSSKYLPIDFQQTNIEGANHKSVSPDVIVTRKQDNDSILTETTLESKNNSPSKEKVYGSAGNDGNIAAAVHSNTADEEDSDNLHSDSDSDPELESFVNEMVNKKWTRNLTTPNLNRKFWDDNYSYNESNLSLDQISKSNQKFLKSLDDFEENNHEGRRSRKKSSIKSFRDSFKNFRTDFSELKYFGHSSKKTNGNK